MLSEKWLSEMHSLADLRSSAFPFILIKILANTFKERGHAIDEIPSRMMVDGTNLFPMLDLEAPLTGTGREFSE